jgi:hypothetical protein
MTTVFDKDTLKEGFLKTDVKFLKGLSFRKWKFVAPRPLKSVKPITAVYIMGYSEKKRKASTKGIQNI